MKKHCHCGAEFDKHEGGEKDGSLHCNNCGCCFLADGETIRPGHSACAMLTAELEAATADEAEEPPPPKPEPASGDAAVTRDVSKAPLKEGVTDGDAAPAEDTESPERRTRRG